MNLEERIALLEGQMTLLKKSNQRLQADNLELQNIVERMYLHLAELRNGREIFAVLLESVAEAYEVTTHQIWHEFPRAWIGRNPQGAEWDLFGKNRVEYLENRICQARLLLVAMAKYVYDRTHGEIRNNFNWYAQRQDATVRKIWGLILDKKKGYENMHDKYVAIQQLARKRLEEDITKAV